MSNLRKENGRIDHAPGQHDDAVIAYLLGYWFLSEAKNKSHYGINTRDVLSIVTTVDVYLSGGKDVLEKQAKNNELKRNVRVLEDQLERCHSEYEKMIIGNKIKYYRDQIEDDIDNNLNQDTFIEEAKSYLKYTITKPYSNLYNLDSSLLAS